MMELSFQGFYVAMLAKVSIYLDLKVLECNQRDDECKQTIHECKQMELECKQTLHECKQIGQEVSRCAESLFFAVLLLFTEIYSPDMHQMQFSLIIDGGRKGIYLCPNHLY